MKRPAEALLATLLLLTPGLAPVVRAQQKTEVDSNTRSQLHTILKTAHDDVAKNYYDPHYHGVNIDALYKQMDAKLDSVQTLNQGFTVIASYLQALHDSHTNFQPPRLTTRTETGFTYRMVGDQCFIIKVQPGSDAAAKLHPGDQLLSYDGFKLEPATFNAMEYYFSTVATTRQSDLVLRAPDGTVRKESVKHKVFQGSRYTDWSADVAGVVSNNYHNMRYDEWQAIKPRFLDLGSILVWKLSVFNLNEEETDFIFARRVDKHSTLILDLRGNPGGYLTSLQSMLGHFFDHEITIATVVARKPDKPRTAKPKSHIFAGKLIVLVDSESASAAELFARVIQLEHRGTVLGERTSGQVMEAITYRESMGADMVATYGFSITHADLHMTDGHSLENTGVTPDELLLPTAKDVAAGRDPLLEKAITEAGGVYDPQAVAKAFPVIWDPLDTL
jgi:C-terminal processing protease CtpA/Prc